MRRVLFRFSFLYFTLYALGTKLSGGLLLLPDRSFNNFGTLWPMRPITFWVAETVFGQTGPLQYTGNSLDTNFFWFQWFWLATAAVLGTAVWSALDRSPRDYATLNTWFRVFLRFAVASQMFEYATTKIIPVQFPRPSLETLLTPVGDVSMQGLMWTFIGASPPYQIFTGVVELLAGVLLILPSTTTLGAAIALASMLQVLVLNLSYDVGVKMMSFNLILMNLALLAPALPRLANFLVLNRAAAPAAEPPLFATPRANRRALAAQVLFGLYLLGVYTNITWRYWQATDAAGRQSPLYGIWDVEALSINGETGPVLRNEYDRQWRRVVIDEPGSIMFQRFDDSFATYGATIDAGSRTIDLRKGASRQWKSTFAYERTTKDGLILEGDMEGDHIRLALRLVPEDTFRLLNSHFRWVRPPDP